MLVPLLAKDSHLFASLKRVNEMFLYLSKVVNYPTARMRDNVKSSHTNVFIISLNIQIGYD